jgi:hypothetical protein
MAAWRNLGTLAIILASTAGAYSQPSYSLTEDLRAGDCFRVRLEMKLNGEWHVRREDKAVPVKIAATARHDFAERVLVLTAENVPVKTVRYYHEARATIAAGGQPSERVLPPDRRLIIAQRHKDQIVAYCPEGPLSRDELETLEHLDSLHLAGLLPSKAVAIGDTWKVGNTVAQAICGFDGLIQQELVCKLYRVEGDEARIAVSGSASGITLGAMVRLTIDATATYHLKQKRLTALSWQQKDVRDQGPANPASTVEASWTLARTMLDQEPKEVSDYALIPLGLPEGAEPPEAQLQLVHRDSQDRFQITYERDWHTAGVTPEHLILRLMDRGDWVAQATLTPWAKAAPGKHLSAEAFKRAMDETPGWEADEIQEDGEMPAREGYWVYRVSALGEMDGLKVLQHFFLVAGPHGDQVVVAVTLRPAMAAKLGTRDLKLVAGIDLGTKGK